MKQFIVAEPVASNEDWWLALAERHAASDWNSNEADGFLKAVKALVNDALAAAPPVAPMTERQERARSLVEDWHEGVTEDAIKQWCNAAAGALAGFAADGAPVTPDLSDEQIWRAARGLFVDTLRCTAFVRGAKFAIATLRGEAR